MYFTEARASNAETLINIQSFPFFAKTVLCGSTSHFWGSEVVILKRFQGQVVDCYKIFQIQEKFSEI